ncbi:hypothetical protein QFC19_006789 [Naganishia cerealis]|uniref:Uncharacterized protein n=1 Tax=Naganishia cerealis TaxID=610337 RepID=A0ACC2VDE4_9TREE|nr:hypothetical protein QFC19_006789 [Naganishia cerealis]
MVNFSSSPDEIIVSEKQHDQQQHASVVDSLDVESEKPYHSHLESSQPIEGHSLGPLSTRDTEKGTASEYASTVEGGEHVSEARAEKRLLRKLDVIILPLAALLYLSAYLDRGNLGNARLQGLEKEVLGGADEKYSLALACFYITYIVFSIPGTLLAKQINPSTAISIGALVWSIAATCQAATKNPTGCVSLSSLVQMWSLMSVLFVHRFLFQNQGVVAGAFGGLLAFAVSSITHSAIAKWRILFLIEGLPSLVLAVCVFLFMPTRPQTSRYLTEDERIICITRLNKDSLVENEIGIDWRGVKRAFMDWKTYVVAIMYSCMNLTLGSVSGFLPTIIKGLGYTEARAQLFTVPPYAVALVVMVGLSTISDRLRTRGIPAASVFIIGIVGWVILFTVHTDLHARYFACICIVTAGYCAIPIIMSWQSNNTGSQSQRAVSLGMLNTIGPRFVKGIALNIAFQALGFILALSMSAYYRWENKRRDRVEGGRPPKDAVLNTMEEFDLAPGKLLSPPTLSASVRV